MVNRILKMNPKFRRIECSASPSVSNGTNDHHHQHHQHHRSEQEGSFSSSFVRFNLKVQEKQRSFRIGQTRLRNQNKTSINAQRNAQTSRIFRQFSISTYGFSQSDYRTTKISSTTRIRTSTKTSTRTTSKTKHFVNPSIKTKQINECFVVC